MILPFDTVNTLRKRKAQKDFSLYKRFLEKFKKFEDVGSGFFFYLSGPFVSHEFCQCCIYSLEYFR